VVSCSYDKDRREKQAFFNLQEQNSIAAADCYVTMEASSSETRTCGVATGVPTAVDNRLFHRVLLARGKVLKSKIKIGKKRRNIKECRKKLTIGRQQLAGWTDGQTMQSHYHRITMESHQLV